MEKMSYILLLPFSALTAFFFYTNPDVDRGEYGSFWYTATKVLPILALSASAYFGFKNPPKRISVKVSFLDEIINFVHPAALAFFLSAIGDVLLANRSNSMTDFILGVIPFAAAHYLNSKLRAQKLTSGQVYWKPVLVYIIVHSAILGAATGGGLFRRTTSPFHILTLAGYSLVLARTVWCAISDWHYDRRRDTDRSTLFYMLGYISFMLSDSAIMFDEFCAAIPRSQIFILITYYAAQGFFFLSFASDYAKAKAN